MLWIANNTYTAGPTRFTFLHLWNCLLIVVHHASVSAKISTSFTICRKTWIRKRAWGKLKSFGYLNTRLSIVLICYWWISCQTIFFECLFSVCMDRICCGIQSTVKCPSFDCHIYQCAYTRYKATWDCMEI